MNLLIKICIAVFVCSPVACGDSDLPESDAASPVQQVKEVSTGKENLHTIQGMKKIMDDARGVEDLLQKHQE
jgi:hypothetical protein